MKLDVGYPAGGEGGERREGGASRPSDAETTRLSLLLRSFASVVSAEVPLQAA